MDKQQIRRFKRIREKLSLFFGKQEKFISKQTINETWINSVYIPQSSVVFNYKKYVVIIKKRRVTNKK